MRREEVIELGARRHTGTAAKPLHLDGRRSRGNAQRRRLLATFGEREREGTVPHVAGAERIHHWHVEGCVASRFAVDHRVDAVGTCRHAAPAGQVAGHLRQGARRIGDTRVVGKRVRGERHVCRGAQQRTVGRNRPVRVQHRWQSGGAGSKECGQRTVRPARVREYGVNIVSTEEELRADTARKDDCRRLKLEPGAPLLLIDRVAVSLEGTRVEWRTSRCDTTHFVYAVTLS